LEEQDEGFVVCKGILEAGVHHWDARWHEARSVGCTSSTSLWIHLTMGRWQCLEPYHWWDTCTYLMAEIGRVVSRKEGTNKMFLIKKLMRLRYKEGTQITDYVN
jgi:hypothetical protein